MSSRDETAGTDDSAMPATPDEHVRFADDAVAYRLGALSPEETRAFELHRLSCARCLHDDHELGALADALLALPEQAWMPEPPPETLLPRLLRTVDRERHRRSARAAVFGAVAACLVAALVGVGIAVWPSSSSAQAVALTPPNGGKPAVVATVEVVAHGSGSTVTLRCRDDAPVGGAPDDTSYSMRLTNRAGAQQDLAWWPPPPGQEIDIAATTNWPRSQISRVEVLDEQGHTVLLLNR